MNVRDNVVAGVMTTAYWYAAEQYEKQLKKADSKPEEERKQDDIRVKPILPPGCGTKVDLYV